MARIIIEEEDDEDEDESYDDFDDELDIETVDDDDELSEPGETWGWPSAVSFVAFVFAMAFMWHDCVVHH